jgi:hypothetical protein
MLGLCLVILAGCAAPQQAQPEATPTQCAWPEIPSDGGCCRDLNENGFCDTIDLAQEIEQQKQQEYEEAAQKARETAEAAGKYRRTIVNDLYDQALAVKGYRFLYEGDEVVVANGSVVRKLVNEYDLGIQEIQGRRQKVVVNEVILDKATRTAQGRCVPRARVKLDIATPCDAIIGMTFQLSYDSFAVKLPIEWLADFLYRTPFESLPSTDIGRRKTTLYRFTDLADAQRKTNLWIDQETKMPLRAEVWQGDELVQKEWHSDLWEIQSK